MKIRMMKILDRKIKEAKASLEVIYKISNKYNFGVNIHNKQYRREMKSHLMRATVLENKIERLKVIYGIVKRFGI